MKKIYRKSLIENIPGCVEVTVLVTRHLKNGQQRTIQETGVVCDKNLGEMRERLVERALSSARFKGASKLLNKNLRTAKGRGDTYDATMIERNISHQIMDIRFYYTVDPSVTIKSKTINRKRYNIVYDDGVEIEKQRMRYFRSPEKYIEEDKTFDI